MEKKKPKTRQGVIDKLPDNIKNELHQMIFDDYPVYILKRILERKYQGKTNLFPITYNTYKRFIQTHKADIVKKFALENALLNDTSHSEREIAECVQNSLDDLKSGNVGVDNTRKNFKWLYERLMKRIKVLEAAQGKVVFDSHLESVILGYRKEGRALLEAASKIVDHMKDNYDKEIIDTLIEITDGWSGKIPNICKKVFGNNPKQMDELKRHMEGEVKQHMLDYFECNVVRSLKSQGNG